TRRRKKRTTPGIRWSSPIQLLIQLSAVYLGESGRDPEFSTAYGRTYQFRLMLILKKGCDQKLLPILELSVARAPRFGLIVKRRNPGNQPL
ncbi:hypothetical protein N658DRAFT_221691, partial [Parathielavia hyrcaniae]